MTLNFFIVFYIIMFNGFDGYHIERYMVFKYTYNLLIGNYNDIMQGYSYNEHFPFNTI
jgi:hypothetical protein